MQIAIFGATSAIAQAVGRHYASERAELYLVGRNGSELDRIAADLTTRGATSVTCDVVNLADPATHAALVERIQGQFERPEIALIAWGTLTEQARAETDVEYADTELSTNFTAPALLCLRLGQWFEQRGEGCLAVITSVAGDRGRQSNFVYGAAKGGLQRFLEGLRHRLYRRGVAVLDIRPGFVATPMTAHLDQSGPLWATPEQVANTIVRAIGRRQDVLYTPWFWRWIMLIVTSVPRFIFHRTKL